MAKAKIVIKKRKLSNNNYPIALRVIHMSNPALYIRLNGLSVKLDEWNSNLSRFTTKKKGFKKLNNILADIEQKADSILELLEAQNEFSYFKFKERYYGNGASDSNVINKYNEKIYSLTALKKYSTAEVYKTSLKAFKEFADIETTFSDITFLFINKFVESRMLKNNSGNYISIILRSLRAIHYSYCDELDIPRPNCYSKFKIKHIETRTAKQGLDKHQLKRFLEYTPESTYDEIAKDLFIFSVLTRGCNLTDILNLTKDNLFNNQINYRRSKTNTPFIVNISKDINAIIEKYQSSSMFLFPFLEKYKGQNTAYKNKLFNRTMNAQLKKIALKLNIPPFSTYASRRTWAQISQANNVPIEMISAGLGHSELRTTQIYLSGFSTDKLDSITKDLLDSLNY